MHPTQGVKLTAPPAWREFHRSINEFAGFSTVGGGAVAGLVGDDGLEPPTPSV